MARMYDIFLSYAHDDSSIAEEIRTKLASVKLSCFMAEKDIRLSEEWELQIRNALRFSNVVLLLITPRSCNSRWILLESGASWVLQKSIIPLIMFVDASDLPDPIRAYQAKRIETRSEIQELVKELKNRQPRGAYRGGNLAPDRLTFQDILAELEVFLHRITSERWIPDLVIGSGRGGIICAAVIATNLGHKPLRLIDCQFEWRGTRRVTTLDCSSLCREEVAGKKVLVVESTRQTGETYEAIEAELSKHSPSEIRSFVTIWRTRATSEPDYYAFHLDSIPEEPWDLGFLYTPHTHYIDEIHKLSEIKLTSARKRQKPQTK
jgi:uncharacterized protein